MDTERIVQTDGYRREDVPEKDRRFLEGVDFSIQELGKLKYNIDVYMGDTGIPTLDKAMNEFAELVIDWCRDFLSISSNEAQISFCDNE